MLFAILIALTIIAAFCIWKTSPKKTCGQCGRKINVLDNFCRDCGTKVPAPDTSSTAI